MTLEETKSKNLNDNLRWIVSLIIILTTLLGVGGWVRGTQKDLDNIKGIAIKASEQTAINDRRVVILETQFKQMNEQLGRQLAEVNTNLKELVQKKEQ
jgi:hypothetical protein